MIPRYRAWIKPQKHMVGKDDLLVIDYDLTQIMTQQVFFEKGLAVERDIKYYDFEDVVLMQSTGLKDKNGKEIFEGDILGTKDGLLNGIVVYRTDLGMWTNTLLRYNNFERLCNIANSRKILGNIYENPELLEVE